MSIKSNTKNTLNLLGVENINYTIQEKTNNINLLGNVLTANNKADSKDSCKMQITGIYNGQSYTNNLIIYVEPKDIDTIEGNEYYKIYTAQDLVRLSELVNHNIGSIKNAIMMNDIDLQGIDWVPMGNIYTNDNDYVAFKGIFDGQNYTIKNMNINVGKEYNYSYVGFIGGLIGGVVKNLQFDNPDVYSELVNTAVVVGNSFNDSIIENVKVLNGNVETTRNYVGGICGQNEKYLGENASIIRNCSNNATITSSADYVGGICGHNYQSIVENCYNTGNINSSSRYKGEICGYSR